MNTILEELTEFGELLCLKPKIKIVSPSLKDKSFFFIKNGYLQKYYSIKGKKHVFRLIESGDYCESFTVLQGEKNNYEYIETVSDTVIIKFDYQKSIIKINNSLMLSNFFKDLLSNFLFFQEKRILNFLALSPKERYKEFIETNYQKIGKYPDHIIASYLGITKETFSRFRNRKS
ncbi:MAG TPA: hypothetical protein PK079_12150 [Leptospiraceae bacterium]|nr:hypothetical protein [Leptospiraceae bacterium]HMW06548.1 hypothetical protein [Leptospiraceae bacterium]HMX35242.1 hypothetical protein [Leptospiraceae bacterium]HMY31262.1 hypothetical protein [Leptospiraceae bacterium]HMZ67263.1 hypothetical protein [Leptospiraceae bacterium]